MAYWLTIATSESQNAAGNQSTVRADLYLNTNNGTSWWGTTISGSISIGGNVSGFSRTSGGSASGSWSALIHSHAVTFNHDANGYRGAVGTAGYFGPGSNVPSLSVGGTTYGAIDYDRRPASPSFASVSRNIDSLTVTLNTVSSPAGTPTYRVERREGSGAWGDEKIGQTVTYTNLTRGVSHQFRARADNSDGFSAYTESQSYAIPTAPEAPAFINVTPPSALSVTVSTGNAPTGGAAITEYRALASPDDGTTWLPSQPMVSQSTTFSQLTPGATYKFATFAKNEMGDGAQIVSDSVFIPAGGKRWNGTSWNPTSTAKRWNGTAWVDLSIAKRWNGTAWVDLS